MKETLQQYNFPTVWDVLQDRYERDRINVIFSQYEMSYKIKWQGYPKGEQWTSWVLESDMVHAWDLLENFKHRDRLAQVGSTAVAHTALDQARSGQVGSGCQHASPS